MIDILFYAFVIVWAVMMFLFIRRNMKANYESGFYRGIMAIHSLKQVDVSIIEDEDRYEGQTGVFYFLSDEDAKNLKFE